MSKDVLKKGFYKAGKYLNKNSANILTGLGMIGVVSTAVLTAKETPKALKVLNEKEEYKLENYNEPLTKFEKVLAVTPVYFPAILMGATTMSCIYGANYINKQQQAILAGAYSYLSNCYDEYRCKVKEVYGEDADKKIISEIAMDKYVEVSGEERPGTDLYYDEYSNRYFNFDTRKLPNILYEINKLYNFTGELTLNNIYEFLGLEETEFGATVGWAATKDWECNGFAWIDIQMEPLEFPDNLTCGMLTFNIEPSADYYQWTW